MVVVEFSKKAEDQDPSPQNLRPSVGISAARDDSRNLGIKGRIALTSLKEYFPVFNSDELQANKLAFNKVGPEGSRVKTHV